MHFGEGGQNHWCSSEQEQGQGTQHGSRYERSSLLVPAHTQTLMSEIQHWQNAHTDSSHPSTFHLSPPHLHGPSLGDPWTVPLRCSHPASMTPAGTQPGRDPGPVTWESQHWDTLAQAHLASSQPAKHTRHKQSTKGHSYTWLCLQDWER